MSQSNVMRKKKQKKNYYKFWYSLKFIQIRSMYFGIYSIEIIEKKKTLFRRMREETV